jgi:hypothetical protein
MGFHADEGNIPAKNSTGTRNLDEGNVQTAAREGENREVLRGTNEPLWSEECPHSLPQMITSSRLITFFDVKAPKTPGNLDDSCMAIKCEKCDTTSDDPTRLLKMQ